MSFYGYDNCPYFGENHRFLSCCQSPYPLFAIQRCVPKLKFDSTHAAVKALRYRNKFERVALPQEQLAAPAIEAAYEAGAKMAWEQIQHCFQDIEHFEHLIILSPRKSEDDNNVE